MSWRPRSERLSGERPTYDGLPTHMHDEAVGWMSQVDEDVIAGYYRQNRLAPTVALRTGVSLRGQEPSGPRLLYEALAQGGDEKALDVIEGYLQICSEKRAKELRDLFTLGGHTLTVGPEPSTLSRSLTRL